MNFSEINLASSHLPPWLIASLIVLLSTGIMLVLKRLILGHLGRLANKTHYVFDSLLVRSISFPLTIIILVVNLVLLDYLLTHFSVINLQFDTFTQMFAKILLIVALLLFVDRLASGAIGGYAQRSDALRSSSGILGGITRGLILVIGVLVILGTLGISVTPLIASLGITSLAVALALQPTLENFFSGVQLVVDKPFRVGDFIELDSGEKGFVEKIGWRSTAIKMLPNNTVIMPNSLLCTSKVINYFYPARELSVPVEVGVHYNSDLEKVEKVTLEVARDILKTHEYGVPDYDTFVIFHTFDSSSINFTVMLRAREFFHQFFIRSAFIKALHRRYAEEGIVIPYPIRAINTQQEHVDFRSLMENSGSTSR